MSYRLTLLSFGLKDSVLLQLSYIVLFILQSSHYCLSELPPPKVKVFCELQHEKI